MKPHPPPPGGRPHPPVPSPRQDQTRNQTCLRIRTVGDSTYAARKPSKRRGLRGRWAAGEWSLPGSTRPTSDNGSYVYYAVHGSGMGNTGRRWHTAPVRFPFTGFPSPGMVHQFPG